MALKEFAKATLRTAIAFFIGLLALLLVIAAYSWAMHSYEEKEAKPYETIRKWEANLQKALMLDINVRTKMVGGKLLASIKVDGYPPYLSAPKNESAQLILEFLDKDGFKAYIKSLNISEFTSIVSQKGEKTGLEYQFEDSLDLDKYKKFYQMQISWTLDSKAPEHKVQAVPTLPKIQLDHCAPNISKSERLKRLAQYGAIREAGRGHFEAGDSSIHFYDDGTLMLCK